MGFEDAPATSRPAQSDTSDPAIQTRTADAEADYQAPSNGRLRKRLAQKDVLINDLNIRFTPELARKMGWSLVDIQNIFR